MSGIGQPSTAAFLTSVPTSKAIRKKMALRKSNELSQLTATTNVEQDSPVAFLEEAEGLLITGQGRSLKMSEVEAKDTLIVISLQRMLG